MFSLFINSCFIILSIKYSFITIPINIENINPQSNIFFKLFDQNYKEKLLMNLLIYIMENCVNIGKNFNYSFHIVYIGTWDVFTVQLYTV